MLGVFLVGVGAVVLVSCAETVLIETTSERTWLDVADADVAWFSTDSSTIRVEINRKNNFLLFILSLVVWVLL